MWYNMTSPSFSKASTTSFNLSSKTKRLFQQLSSSRLENQRRGIRNSRILMKSTKTMFSSIANYFSRDKLIIHCRGIFRTCKGKKEGEGESSCYLSPIHVCWWQVEWNWWNASDGSGWKDQSHVPHTSSGHFWERRRHKRSTCISVNHRRPVTFYKL